MRTVELKLVAIEGDRRDAFRELRRLTPHTARELANLLKSLPGPLFVGPEPEARELVAAASDLLKLELWHGSLRLEVFETGNASQCGHVEQRVFVERSPKSVRFAVDEVEPSHRPLCTETESQRWAELSDTSPVHVPAARQFVKLQEAQHPLAAAISLAFNEHFPLRLTPDSIWLTLAAGFAQHIELRAESLRGQFVSHSGRHTLSVHWRGSWEDAIEDLCSGAREHLNSRHHQLFQCNFSTSTALDQVASDVVFLSAFKHYFDNIMLGICGIPEIELMGTVGDWQSIRTRIDSLAEYTAKPWVKALRPLADEWVRTAQGEPDLAFWRAICKPEEAYGEREVTGWMTQLFPYLESGATNASIGSGGPETGFCYRPLALSTLPLGLATTSVRTDSQGTFNFVGGLAGVTQGHDTFLQPVSGWAVIARPYTRLLDRLGDEHELVPISGPKQNEHLEQPAELIELHGRCDGAVIHGGRWRIRGANQLQSVYTSDDPGEGADYENIRLRIGIIFADLEDGRSAALLPKWYPGASRHDWWVVPVPSNGVIPTNAPIISKGFDAFLEAVLNESSMPFFEEPDFVPEGFVDENSL